MRIDNTEHPAQRALRQIEAMLLAAGWGVQDCAAMNRARRGDPRVQDLRRRIQRRAARLRGGSGQPAISRLNTRKRSGSGSRPVATEATHAGQTFTSRIHA